MHRQSFVFNPMQLHGGSSQYSRQHGEESAKDFGPIGGAVRGHRQQFQQNSKNAEPLLLPPATKTRNISEGQKEKVANKNGDKLATLHSKLHQEAEKIKQWKINTEMKLKEKDRKMNESTKTIESLRKSILELQFLNESVSSELHEEKTLKEETIQKISTTRNMCNALKEHLVKLESSVIVGENMLDAQKFENCQKIEHYQDLVLKFQELEIKSNSKDHDMKKYVANRENTHMEEIESQKKKIIEGEKSIKALQDINNDHESNISKLTEQLAQANQELQCLKDEYSCLQGKFEEVRQMFTVQENVLNEEKNLKITLMEEIKNIEDNYGQKISNMTSEYEALSKEITDKQNMINLKDLELQQKQNEVEHLTETVMKKTIETEQTQIEVDALNKFKSELEISNHQLREDAQKVSALLQEKESLLQEKQNQEGELERIIQSERETSNEMRHEITQLQTEIQRLTEQEAVNTATYKAKVKELEIAEEGLKNQIEAQHTDIESEVARSIVLEQENQRLLEECKKMEEGIKEIKAEKECIVKEFDDKTSQLEQLSSQLEQAKQQIQHQEAKLAEISQERDQHVDAIQQEVGSRDKKIESTESKIKTIQSKLDVKVKQANKFQSEIKSLKAQLKVQHKATKKLEDELQQAEAKIEEQERESKTFAESADQKFKETIQDYQRVTATSEILHNEKEQLLKEIEQLGNQTETSKQQSEMAKQQLIQEKQSFEAQITEMCSTLEKYKMENEKLMKAKEKELDKQTRDMIKTKCSFEEDLGKKQSEIDSCKTNIEDKEKKITELNDELRKMKQRILELESSPNLPEEPFDEKMDTEDSTDTAAIIRKEQKQVKKTVFQSPKPNQAVSPKTPKTPRTPQMINPTTPTASLQTPQGILRVSEEKPARSKRVAFSLTDAEDISDNEDILAKTKKSPSVVSDMKKPSKVNSVRPTIRSSPSLSAPKSSPMISKTAAAAIESPGKRLKRIQAVKTTQKTTEKDAFKKLFPSFEENAKIPDASSSSKSIKKSPFKSKVKKVTPKAKRDIKKDGMDFSWFDTDSAFGFGMEE